MQDKSKFKRGSLDIHFAMKLSTFALCFGVLGGCGLPISLLPPQQDCYQYWSQLKASSGSLHKLKCKKLQTLIALKPLYDCSRQNQPHIYQLRFAPNSGSWPSPSLLICFRLTAWQTRPVAYFHKHRHASLSTALRPQQLAATSEHMNKHYCEIPSDVSR